LNRIFLMEFGGHIYQFTGFVCIPDFFGFKLRSIAMLEKKEVNLLRRSDMSI
jgi:hypothetical protein